MEKDREPSTVSLNDDIVFLSPWLEKTYPAFFHRFITLLDRLSIQWAFLPNTNDIWCRDFMPFVADRGDYLQYRYYPDYLLQQEKDKYYITDAGKVCEALHLPCLTTDIILDGGNMVKAGDFLIMTEKIYKENPGWPPDELCKELERLTHLKLLLLPWDKAERYGHSDGIVRPIDAHRVLMTNYADFDPEIAREIKKRLQAHFYVIQLEYKVHRLDPRSWVFINYLEAGNVIILPALGISEDEQAMKQIREVFPHKYIAQIRMEEIVKQGGALNCISWTLGREDFYFFTRSQG